MSLPTDPTARKTHPIASGVLDYFPLALAAVAHVSYVGNVQHNGPDVPLFWDRTKSTDESDALIRHFLERGKLDTDGLRHSAKMAWRALALLEKELEGTAAAVNPAIPRQVISEPGCSSSAPCSDSWTCEREQGHKGDHMAWDRYDPTHPETGFYADGR